jgi:hypothetical protein
MQRFLHRKFCSRFQPKNFWQKEVRIAQTFIPGANLVTSELKSATQALWKNKVFLL